MPSVHGRTIQSIDTQSGLTNFTGYTFSDVKDAYRAGYNTDEGQRRS